MLKLKITKDYSNIKPMGYLKKNIDVSFEVIRLLIDKKKILLNNEKFNNNILLKDGDVITIMDDKITLRKKIIKDIQPINMKLEEIYEDKNVLIFSKPPFLSVQGGGIEKETLLNHLSYLKQKKKLDFLEAIHRIDKNTSGILVVAKSLPVLRSLHKLLKEEHFFKKYTCLVEGIPKKRKGKVELHLIVRNNQKQKVIVDNSKDLKGSKYSLSFYKVVRTYNYNDKQYSLIEVEIKTGITHQIRVHMKYLGCSIVGDRMYGNEETNKVFHFLGLDRQFLHATNVIFENEGKKYNINSKLSMDLQKILKITQKNSHSKK